MHLPLPSVSGLLGVAVAINRVTAVFIRHCPIPGSERQSVHGTLLGQLLAKTDEFTQHSAVRVKS